MTPQDEREAVEAAVHATIVRWSNGEQPKPLKTMVVDAILALRQPGAEYRRAVEDAARVAADGARFAKFSGIAAGEEAKGESAHHILQAVARDIRALTDATPPV